MPAARLPCARSLCFWNLLLTPSPLTSHPLNPSPLLPLSVYVASLNDDGFAPGPQQLLSLLPGMRGRALRVVLERVSSLRELVNMSKEDMQELVGEKLGQNLYDFCNNNSKS